MKKYKVTFYRRFVTKEQSEDISIICIYLEAKDEDYLGEFVSKFYPNNNWDYEEIQ